MFPRSALAVALFRGPLITRREDCTSSQPLGNREEREVQDTQGYPNPECGQALCKHTSPPHTKGGFALRSVAGTTPCCTEPCCTGSLEPLADFRTPGQPGEEGGHEAVQFTRPPILVPAAQGRMRPIPPLGGSSTGSARDLFPTHPTGSV